MLPTGASSVISAALIVDTALPTARRSVAPAVPATTTPAIVPAWAASTDVAVASSSAARATARPSKVDPNALRARWSGRGEADTKHVMANLQMFGGNCVTDGT